MKMLEYIAQNGDALKKSVFVASNPTFGTGIALNANPTAIAATEGSLVIANEASRSSAENHEIVPLYIKLICTAAGTGATSIKTVLKLDNIDRYSSGGTELTPKTTSYDTSDNYADRTPKGAAYFGDLTLAAASSEKQVSAELLKTASAPCLAVGDVFTIHFGGDGVGAHPDGDDHMHFSAPPVWIGPGCSLIMQMLNASQSAAASFEVEIGWIERNHDPLT
jgi:hypothetical protein